MSNDEMGKCPHCGGESDGSVMYSAPLQTKCRDCGKTWGFGGPAIDVVEGPEHKRKRPGMYFRWCEAAAAMGAWHLHEPEAFGPDHKPKYGGWLSAKTLCGLKAAWDVNAVVTLDAIMEESKGPGRTCPGCREAFLAMTEKEDEQG